MKKYILMAAAAILGFAAPVGFAVAQDGEMPAVETLEVQVLHLSNGTVVHVKGDNVFIVAADGSEIVAPDGEHELANGETITVTNGKLVTGSEMESDHMEHEMDEPAAH